MAKTLKNLFTKRVRLFPLNTATVTITINHNSKYTSKWELMS